MTQSIKVIINILFQGWPAIDSRLVQIMVIHILNNMPVFGINSGSILWIKRGFINFRVMWWIHGILANFEEHIIMEVLHRQWQHQDSHTKVNTPITRAISSKQNLEEVPNSWQHLEHWCQTCNNLCTVIDSFRDRIKVQIIMEYLRRKKLDMRLKIIMSKMS